MSLLQLSLFYKNLYELYSAGISFVSMFATLQTSESDSLRRSQFKNISEHVSKGRTLAEAFRRTAVVPVQDLAVVHSGEKAGNLQLVFENLSKNYAQAAAAEKTIRGGLVRPLCTLAAALFIPSFPDLFTGKITLARYLLQSFGVLGVVLALVYFLYQLYMQSLYDLQMARTRHRIFLMIPFLGTLSKKMALEKFISGLSLMLESGLPIFEALTEAGRCSADAEIQAAGERIVKSLKAGKSLPQSFQPESVFTAEIQNSILLGNESGKIPGFLQRSSAKLRGEVAESVERISKAIPVVVYWIVTLYVASTIIGFYRGHLKDLDNALNNS